MPNIHVQTNIKVTPEMKTELKAALGAELDVLTPEQEAYLAAAE